ncbi:MAG TPA: SCO family protein [Longimicrobiales bacterium]|nr:SCO family protein [Longimicrobiales bacterium]
MMKRLTVSVTVLMAVLAGCTGAPPAADVVAGDTHAHHDMHAPAPVEPLAGMSVYQLDDVWLDRHGAERVLADLRGRPQLIAMVYTNCGSACPRIVADMKRLEGEFSDVGFVLVSIDPERDTPEQLDSFATATRLSDRWTVLAGPDESIATLAAVLGVRYRQVSATDFMHSNVITVLDAGGSIVHRQEALGEVDGTIAALQRLAGPVVVR